MKIELDLFPDAAEWPRCYYDPDLLCGDPETGALIGNGQVDMDREKMRRHWHVGDFCDCPSCPIRCAVRDALAKYRANV